MTNEHDLYQTPNIGCMLGTAYQVLAGQLADALSEAGLDITVPEYIILRALYSRECMQLCEIATLIGKDKGAVSRCVAAMNRKGLVHTEPVSYKCLKVSVGNEGQRIRPRVMAVAEQRHSALTTLLTPDEMVKFTDILSKIINQRNKKG